MSVRITTIEMELAVRFLEGFCLGEIRSGDMWSGGVRSVGQFAGVVVHHGDMVSRGIVCPMELCSCKNPENCLKNVLSGELCLGIMSRVISLFIQLFSLPHLIAFQMAQQ